MSYLAHLGTRFDAGLESLGHVTWKLLRKNLRKHSNTIERGVSFVQFTNTICCWFGVLLRKLQLFCINKPGGRLEGWPTGGKACFFFVTGA